MFLQCMPYPTVVSLPIAALIYNSGTTVPPGAGIVNWDLEAFDWGEWFNPAAPTLYTVPENVSRIRASAKVKNDNVAHDFVLLKNGIVDTRGFIVGAPSEGAQQVAATGHSAWIDVVPGDTFSIDTNASTLTGGSSGAYFAIEAIDPTLKYCLVKRVTDFAVAAATWTTFLWNGEHSDAQNWHDPVTNSGRITPNAPMLVRLTLQHDFNYGGDGAQIVHSWITWNGKVGPYGMPFHTHCVNIDLAHSVTSAIVPFTPGEYFDSGIYTDQAHTMLAVGNNWFQLEEVPADHVYAVVCKSTAQELIAGWNLITWDVEKADDYNLHNSSINPARLTVPPGYNRARLTFNAAKANSNASYIYGQVRMNGAVLPGLPESSSQQYYCDFINGSGSWIEVNPSGGDYFELWIYVFSGQTLTLDQVRNWFQLELKQAD
jgi:hypothetical protein